MSSFISPVFLFHQLLAMVINVLATKTLQCCLGFACYSLLMLPLLAWTPLNKTFYLYSIYCLKKGSTCNAIHSKHKLVICVQEKFNFTLKILLSHTNISLLFPLSLRCCNFSFNLTSLDAAACELISMPNNLNALSMHAVLTVCSRNCGIKDNLTVDGCSEKKSWKNMIIMEKGIIVM